MKNIIITGSTGFVGKNLVEYLKNKEYLVNAISLRNANWNNLITDENLAIIHLAGKAHDTANSSRPEDYFAINRDLTIKLFDKFLDSNIRDFVYFSSVKAVADMVDGVLEEDLIGNPKTPYGKSKLEAENYLLSKNIPVNKRLFIIRPCMIHGPGNKGNLNLLYNIVKKGIPWPLGSFVNSRSFLNIDNLNFLIEKILDNDHIESGIYNFADDGTISTNELVHLISVSLNRRPQIFKFNKKIIEFFVRIGDKLSLPLNSERLQKLTESYVVSNQKIKRAIKIENLPIGIKEGLRATINSFENKSV